MEKFDPKKYERGRYKHKRLDTGYEDAREKCLKRDNFTCQMCNKKFKKSGLQVHHIIKYADSHQLRTEVSNLITLCYKHHKEVTGRENSYVDYFRNKVRKNENIHRR